eukprot:CAMPEP_0206472654 /NCGR_PEP_ID=MMETSP0324_2-20121206/32347_1 /ASSEMBLY_ACC=CAM_ASM_000836 /TAXON_ID=2866 /ORGANISM="Crypthecodinium cohnii, Strain Seligo" /LENGTH=39 /DNA_ID= /DNA_START= /DNA_END= /DNA_ORIENTATION=
MRNGHVLLLRSDGAPHDAARADACTYFFEVVRGHIFRPT